MAYPGNDGADIYGNNNDQGILNATRPPNIPMANPDINFNNRIFCRVLPKSDERSDTRYR